jgi:molybdopterin/thiamine biosynthesis adenylyltransferase
LQGRHVELTYEEMLRYDRQLPLFGVEGQKKLRNLRVLIAGVGGLGSFEALYLAQLGVGKLVLVDYDVIDESNLNRQPLYWVNDVGKPKPMPAVEKLKSINPNVEIEAIHARIDRDLAAKLMERVDIVIDGLDNWQTRFIIDEAAYKAGKPYIHAGTYGLQGQVIVIVPGETSCLRCLLPPRLREPEKVIAVSPMVGMVAAIAVLELVKLVTGVGRANKGSMIVVDGYNMEVQVIPLVPRKGCRCS